MKKLIEKAAEKGCNLQFCCEVSEEKQNSLWYGGEVVTIILKNGYKFHLHANGDVIGELYRSKGINPPELLFDIQDKSNMGCFGIELAQYNISTDEELNVLTDTLSDGQLKKDGYIYTLDISYNNWWEVFITSPDGKWHDLMCDLSSDKLSDAIFEVIDSIPELIKDI